MKKPYKIFMRIVSTLLLFLFFLLSNSANHLLNSWGVNFSTVLYQLNSPLKGTNSDVVNLYLKDALYPSISQTIVFVFLWFVLKVLFGKFQIEIKGHFFRYEFDYVCKITRKNRKKIKSFVIIACSILCIIILWQKGNKVGLWDWVYDKTHASTIFEEEYVDPKTVKIEFGEKKNLLYIYMESMETTYSDIGSGGGKNNDYISNLKNLARENISFSDTDKFGGLFQTSGAGWTMGAILSSMTGVPYKLPIDGNAAGEHEEFLPGITSLGEVLEDKGYCNYFMCGSDINFGGRELFFSEHGNYEMFDYFTAMEDGIIPEGYHVFWGMEDQNLYRYAKDKLTEIAQTDENWNFTMLTVDTHHQEGYICELCNESYQEQYANAISCADRQIVQFLEWVKQQEWYDNTVVVITGDHLSMNKSFFDDLPEDYSRKIYNCIINSDLEPQSGVWNRSASILDMFPTTLAAMGAEIEGDRLGLGTNLFSSRATLAEEMGEKEFMTATSMYSNYYDEKFVKKN